MNAKTLKALKESIAKWQQNARVRKPESYSIGYKDCPLCDLFFKRDCVGCPVRKSTGEWCCVDTPYYAALKAWWRWDIDLDDENLARAARKAARKEVAFLQSLLPEET